MAVSLDKERDLRVAIRDLIGIDGGSEYVCNWPENSNIMLMGDLYIGFS